MCVSQRPLNDPELSPFLQNVLYKHSYHINLCKNVKEWYGESLPNTKLIFQMSEQRLACLFIRLLLSIFSPPRRWRVTCAETVNKKWVQVTDHQGRRLRVTKLSQEPTGPFYPNFII